MQLFKKEIIITINLFGLFRERSAVWLGVPRPALPHTTIGRDGFAFTGVPVAFARVFIAGLGMT